MKTVSIWAKAPIVLLLVLSFGLQSCAAVSLPSNFAPPMVDRVVPLASGSVVNGITRALQGKPGTEILIQDSKIMFVWFYESVGAGFFGLDLKNSSIVDIRKLVEQGGQLSSWKTAADLVNWMKTNGWKAVPAAELSLGLKSALLGAINARISTLLGLYILLPSGTQFQWEFLPGFEEVTDPI